MGVVHTQGGVVGCTDTSAVPTPRARAAEVRSRDREGIKIEIKTHSRSEDEVQKILADCDLHNTIRQQEAHLHHDVAPEEGAADALRPYFLFREGPCLPDGYLNTNYNKQRAIRLLQPLQPTLGVMAQCTSVSFWIRGAPKSQKEEAGACGWWLSALSTNSSAPLCRS